MRTDSCLFDTAQRPEIVAKIEARYPEWKRTSGGVFASGNLRDNAQGLLTHAQGIFRVDGYHRAIAFLCAPAVAPILLDVSPEDSVARSLIWRHVADEAIRCGATSLYAVGEAWMAWRLARQPARPVEEYPTKREVLWATVATRGGEEYGFASEILRSPSIDFGPIKELEAGALAFLEPVRKAWRGH